MAAVAVRTLTGIVTVWPRTLCEIAADMRHPFLQRVSGKGVVRGRGPQCLRAARPGQPGENRRSRRLFVTTNTELKAIAAPAISGLRKPRAASGIAATL